MNIGRKIYFDKASGNVLQDTGERSGNVIETTVEQDFEAYASLAERVRDSIGVIKLPFGEHAENFSRYPYRVDPLSETIIWDVDATGLDLDQLKAVKVKQLTEMCDATIAAGFTSETTGHTYRTTPDDQINFLSTKDDLDDDPSILELPWKCEDVGGLMMHSRDEFYAVVREGKAHKRAQVYRLDAFRQQVSAAQTAEEVQGITW